MYNESIQTTLKSIIKSQKTLSEDDIIDRMMIPMLNESARCLEEKIVATAMEVDLGVLYGIGFPPFRAGILKYADDCGLKTMLEKAQGLSHLGGAFEPAPLLKKLADEGKTFYQWTAH